MDSTSLQMEVFITYRENETKDQETVPVDEDIVVKSLQGLGIKPVFAKTNGKKLEIHFLKSECMEAYQKIHQSLSGTLDEPLMIDLNKYILAETGWRAAIAMMHSMHKVR